MKVPLSTRTYARHEDGTVTVDIKGRSPFMLISNNLEHLFDERGAFTDPVNGDRFISTGVGVVLSSMNASCDRLVVKDGIFGRAVRRHCNWLWRNQSKLLRWEARWNPLLQRAVERNRAGHYVEPPVLSITRWVGSTLPRAI